MYIEYCQHIHNRTFFALFFTVAVKMEQLYVVSTNIHTV